MMTVFISHSRQNASAALRLHERLKQRGLQPWLDTCELDLGEDWNQRVAAAIEGAGAFVVLVGPDPEPDRSQRYEWAQITDHEFYLDEKKPMIPVVIGAAEMPGFLRTRHALNVDRSSIDVDKLAEQIAEALGKPEATIDPEGLKRGLDAREQAVKSLQDYSLELEREDVKRAGLRGLK
ncbi:MAG TPA: toll/interleukin-1 receptor domain-containing protein [Dongiaceae bacterium]|nr:toll/interleukin-1 receptor domain-containing protein [Dongiaceae bacterium]